MIHQTILLSSVVHTVTKYIIGYLLCNHICFQLDISLPTIIFSERMPERVIRYTLSFCHSAWDFENG